MTGSSRSCRVRTTWIFVAAMSAVVMTGCFHSRPRQRIGSLPFPGFLTNYQALETPEAGSLGRHQYAHVRFIHGEQGPEVDHGILYTCRAGFLDLAHLRTGVDWTWYGWRRIRASLMKDKWSMRFNGPDLTWWDVSLTKPVEWPEMSESDRQAWIDEVALRTGQRLAYLIQTWHEIVTWHGHRISIIVPEEVSAFTYDDVMSHVIGVRVAERAIRSDIDDYEEAVTAALAQELEELEAVSSEDVRRATHLVRQEWWEGRMAGRHADAGLDDGTVTPWLVQELSQCGQRTPEAFALPWYGQPCGHEGRISLDSILLQVGDVRRSASIDEGTVIEEGHFSALVAAVRREIEASDDIPQPDTSH